MPANLNNMIVTLLSFFSEALEALGMADFAAKIDEVIAKIPVAL